jgi:hypothetical protein
MAFLPHHHFENTTWKCGLSESLDVCRLLSSRTHWKPIAFEIFRVEFHMNDRFVLLLGKNVSERKKDNPFSPRRYFVLFP